MILVIRFREPLEHSVHQLEIGRHRRSLDKTAEARQLILGLLVS
jgi:hypothetical protein